MRDAKPNDKIITLACLIVLLVGACHDERPKARFRVTTRKAVDRVTFGIQQELRLNQQIKGWTMYHRYAVSKRIFRAVDDRIFRKLMRWCRRRHPKKSGKWIKKKNFQREGHRDWVFTGLIRDSTGAARPIRLMQAAGVRVLRWVKIRSAANPYDPEWELYLEERSVWKLTHTLAGRGRLEYLWKEQEGRCVLCGQVLRAEEQPWHIHHRVWRSRGGQETCDNLELLHANCHRQIHST
jgi:RNA-directed DNA polymerase